MATKPDAQTHSLAPSDVSHFHERGFLTLRQFYSPDEVRLLLDTFMGIHANGPVPRHFEPVPPEEANGDPLKRYPRIMQPHHFNDTARSYLLDGRLESVLSTLLGEEPLAAQTMLYFKPAGARGQALHIDALNSRKVTHST